MNFVLHLFLYVVMEKNKPSRRFPPPWKVERPEADRFIVKDGNGVPLVQVPYRDDLKGVPFHHVALTSDEARRIAKAVARLPEFLMQRNGFHSRGGSPHRWSPARPYHVALEDSFIRENYDWITDLCKLNGIPFDGTGERVQGSWLVYSFGVQLEAIMFWDEFKGRWLVGEEFRFPERPENLPEMKRPANWQVRLAKRWRD